MKYDLLFSGFPFIKGDKVTLSRMTEMDIKALWSIISDEENYRYLSTAAAASPPECKIRLRQAEQLFRDKRAVTLGIYPAEGDYRLIGVLSLTDFDKKAACCTLSVVMNRKYAGMGYASSAVRAAVEYLLTNIEMGRVQAYVLPANHRAALMLEHCGFKKEGTIRDGFYWDDKGIVDLSLYSLLPVDLRADKPSVRAYF